jgi:hypothetical protein
MAEYVGPRGHEARQSGTMTPARRNEPSIPHITLAEHTITYLIGPVAAISAYLYSHYIQNAPIQEASLLSILLAYLAQQGAYIFHSFRSTHLNNASQKAAEATADQRFAQLLSTYQQLQQHLDSSLNVQYLSGDPQELIVRLKSSLAAARYVKNTCIHLADTVGPRSAMYGDVISLYEEFFRRNDAVEWHDLVAREDFVGGRFEDIFRERTTEVRASHRITVINTHTPILNFALMGANDKFSEIYFGWVRGSGTGQLAAFYSRDPRLIQSFDDYFNLIKLLKQNNEASVDYGLTPEKRFENDITRKIVGTWVSISGRFNYSGRDRDIAALMGEITEYSIVTFSFTTQYLGVQGRVCNRRGQETFIFDSEYAILRKTDVYMKYNAQGIDRRAISGVAVYSFSPLANHFEMDGFYIETSRDHKNQIRGIKLTNEQLKNFSPDVIEAAIKAIIEREVTRSKPRSVTRASKRSESDTSEIPGLLNEKNE